MTITDDDEEKKNYQYDGKGGTIAMRVDTGRDSGDESNYLENQKFHIFSGVSFFLSFFLSASSSLNFISID